MVVSNRMRTFALAGALASVATLGLLATASPASAQGAWCAEYSGRGGGATNCGFYTWQQCQWAVSGVGGFCSPSPWAAFSPSPGPLDPFAPTQRRKVRRQYR